MVPARLRGVRPGPGGAAGSGGLRRDRGRDALFGPGSGPAHRRDSRRPAGRAAGRGLPGRGRRQVHLRDGRVPPGHDRFFGGAVWLGAVLFGGLAARRAGTDCLDGQVYMAGSALRWLTGIGVLGAPSELDAVGGTVPDAGGVTFVPALAGLGAPYWAPHARGTVRPTPGQRPRHAPGPWPRASPRRSRSASAACEDLERPLSSLRVDGGLTRSRLSCRPRPTCCKCRC